MPWADGSIEIETLMSERYKPKTLKRNRSSMVFASTIRDGLQAEPREQIVWRDGKPTILKPLLCREHNTPWQICTLCSKQKR